MLITPLLLLSALLAFGEEQGPRVLFIRGGPGTGGFLEDGEDDQLSDVFDLDTSAGNHGWGQLKLLLEFYGFEVEQVIEGAAPENEPVDLLAVGLHDYDILVFGSNNAEYSPADRDLVADWVCAGGSALFISDASWGSNWGDAPSSDQTFLDAFDLIVNQDQYSYGLFRSAGDFVIAGEDMGEHPVLTGADLALGTSDDVDAFDGEGVSPLTVTDLIPNVDPVVLAKAKLGIKENTGPGQGPIRPVTDADGALVVLEYGNGRVLGHYDRNTFFNANGIGSNLLFFDNTEYATAIFQWLAGAPGETYGTGCPGPGGFTPRLSLVGCARQGSTIEMRLRNGPGGQTAFLVFGLGAGNATFPNGCPLYVDPLLPVSVPVPLTGSAPGTGTFIVPLDIPPGIPALTLNVQALIPGGHVLGGMGGSNAIRLAMF